MSSSTRLLVLGVVRIFQPVHGYDVRRELLSWRAEEWGNISPGSIYNALKSLTRDRLLEVVGAEQVGGRPERTTYQLTSEGEEQFQSLLRDAWWNVRPPIDPLMTAVSFMSAMPRHELREVLKHRIAQIEAQRAHLKFAIEGHRFESTPEHVREMFRLMEARIASEIAWAEALSRAVTDGEYYFSDDPVAKWPPGMHPGGTAGAARAKAPAGKAKPGKSPRKAPRRKKTG